MNQPSVAGTVVGRRGEIVVERDPRRPTGRLLLQGDMESSYVDLADPRHLEFDYMRWLRIVIRAARARRVLHIGGGACALARVLAVEDARGRQEVCEIDADVLELARQYMGLRRGPGLKVRNVEGRAFLAGQERDSWDAVVIDAFQGAVVPRRLITVEALAEAARVAPLALVNVVDDRLARDVRTIAAGLSACFEWVWTLGVKAGNTIVVGAAARLDLQRIAALAAADPSPARLTAPAELARLLAGRVAIRDAELHEAAG